MATDQRTLGGRYEIGALLGYGGMAEVHLGRDVRLDRDVAVKLLRPDLARDPAFQNRFRREAQSAAALNHPSIVAVYDTGEEEEAGAVVPYIVMEYVEGRTLRELVEEEGRLLPGRALEITAEVCDALEYSHRMGIVHRDIKPGNVMLTRDGAVKVMDFGIARAVTASSATMTQTAAVIGTAQYLSPEQARGEHVDARSDLYSTGCLLFELLTGHPPFSGDSPVAVAYQHVRENPQPPSRDYPDIPPAADAIVLKALTKNPANRYQNAGEMREDIERALSGRPVLATPLLADETAVLGPAAAAGSTAVLAPTPLAGDRRRNRGWVYLLLGLAVIAVFVAALLAARAVLSTGTIRTPRVIGLTLSQARARLTAKGLGVGTVTFRWGAKGTKGEVLIQNPGPGRLTSKGNSVNLVISKGVHDVTVPYLSGVSETGARRDLAAAGLKVGRITFQSDPSLRKGDVISSSPPSGTVVPSGTAVSLVVASGNVLVPDVVGKTQSQAEAILSADHFVYRVVTGPAPAGYGAGTVFGQSPPGGNSAPYNSVVTIDVASAPSPTPPPSTPPPSHSPTPSPPGPSPTGSHHH
jgi:beta-lactam-binding protein with PASTA domain/predicted Ser/Thr protein kinase